MKVIPLRFAALLLVFCSLTAQAYNKVRLTFQRSGTNATSVSVSVTDENGSTIDGVTATLESVTSGTGATSTPATVALFDKNDMASNTNFLGVNMGSNNTLNGYVQFTFKISGLTGFTYNHVDACVASINKEGWFQSNTSSVDKLFYKMEAWNTNNTKPTAPLISNSQFDMNPAPTSSVNNAFWLEGKGNTFTASAEEYLVVRFTKIDATGCFMSLKGIDLYNGYLIRTTAVSNAGLTNVATFSSSTNMEFDGNSKAYIAVSQGESKITLSPLTDGASLEAKQGVIVSNTGTNTYWFYTGNGTIGAGSTTGTASESTKMPVSFAYASTATSDNRTNLLVGGGDETLSLTAGDYFIFNKNSSGAAIFSILSGTSTTLAANKAALKKQGGTQNVLSIDFDSVTGIETATLEHPQTESDIYDLSGRRVKKLTSGVYVRNGKKFLVK